MRCVRGFVIVAAAALGLVAGCEHRGPSNPTAPGGPISGIQTVVDVPIDIANTAGTVGTWNYAGQSFSIPAGTTLTNIRFNWYTRGEGAVAFGSLYLLDTEFLGRPGDLGTNTAGFIAKSQSSEGGGYGFAPDVTIAGGASGRQYFVYTDTMGSFATSFDVDVYRGGDLYVTGYPTNPFRRGQASGRMVNGVFVPAPPNVFIDANFRLQGVPR